MKCICCKKDFPEEDLLYLFKYKKNLCSECSIEFIKQNITGGLDCEDLIKHIKLNTEEIFK